jgi:hypothetical protein
MAQSGVISQVLTMENKQGETHCMGALPLFFVNLESQIYPGSTV